MPWAALLSLSAFTLSVYAVGKKACAGYFHELCRYFFKDFLLTPDLACGILIYADIRRCGGMVDTGDLKSPGSNAVPVRVRSPAPLRFGKI